MSDDSNNNQNLMSFVIEVCSTAVAKIEDEPVVVIALRKTEPKLACFNVAITAENAKRLSDDLSTLFVESETLVKFVKEREEKDRLEEEELMREKQRRLRG